MTLDNPENISNENIANLDGIEISNTNKEGVVDFLESKADKAILVGLLNHVSGPAKEQVLGILVRRFPEDSEIANELFLEDSEKGAEAVRNFLSKSPSIEEVKKVLSGIEDRIHRIVYDYNSDENFLSPSKQELIKYIKENGDGEKDLFYLLGKTSDEDVNNAIGELLDKELSNEQLNQIIRNAGNGIHDSVKGLREKACEKLLKQNPNNDELISIIWGSDNLTLPALDAFLENNPSADQMYSVFINLQYGKRIELASESILKLWDLFKNASPKPFREQLLTLARIRFEGVSEKALDEFLISSPTEDEVAELLRSEYYRNGKDKIVNFILNNPTYRLCTLAMEKFDDPDLQKKFQAQLEQTQEYKVRKIADVLKS